MESLRAQDYFESLTKAGNEKKCKYSDCKYMQNLHYYCKFYPICLAKEKLRIASTQSEPKHPLVVRNIASAIA